MPSCRQKQGALDRWLEERQADLVTLAASTRVRETLATLPAAAPTSAAARMAHDRLVAEFKPWIGGGQKLLAIFVMAPDTGRVIAATDAAEEGRFKEDRPYFVHGTDGPYIQNPYYSLTIQGPAMTASAPIRSAGGRTLGVLAGQLNLKDMGAILARRTTLRQTDDAFLVNPSSLFVTQPRLVSDPSVLQRGIHTEAVKRCLAGTSGVASGADYRGVPVMSGYRWLPERHLCLVVQVDEAEVFAPAHAFGRALILIGMLVLLVGSGVAIGLARAITRPVRALQLGAARIGQGDLDVRLPETSKDELGLLAGEFNRMAAAVSEREAALRESEARHRSLFENSIDAVLLTTPDGGILAANPEACRIFGLTEEEFRQRGRAGTVDPTDPRLPALLEERARTGKVRGELTHVRKDGTRFPGEISSAVFIDRDGLAKTSMIIRDITERKRTEEALAERTRQLEAVRAVGEEITQELDLPTVLGLIIRRAVELAGAKSGAVYLWDEAAQVLVPEVWHGLGDWIKEIRLRLGEGASGTVAQRRAGMIVNDYRASPYAHPFFLEHSGVTATLAEPLLYRDQLLGVITIDNEETGRAFTGEDREVMALFATQAAIAIQNARLFGQVRAGRERLQLLSRQLVDMQEAERRSIARELHDEIGQLLTGIKLLLEMGLGGKAGAARAHMGDALGLINELMERVRDLSLTLRPAMLDDLGLLPALLWHLERYAAQTHVQVHLRHSGMEKRFPPEIETAVYRIIQEALTNVARHAGVRDATVRLWADAGTLGLQIEDGGVGFDPGAPLAAGTSGGLIGMRERALLLGGSLSIESAPGTGTRLTAELPLAGPAEKRKRQR